MIVPTSNIVLPWLVLLMLEAGLHRRSLLVTLEQRMRVHGICIWSQIRAVPLGLRRVGNSLS